MKDLITQIRVKLLRIWRSIVRFFWAFVGFWRNLPRNIAGLAKACFRGTIAFIRNLPTTLRSKDKTIDMLVGTGAIAIWMVPPGVVIYVLIWFLTKR